MTLNSDAALRATSWGKFQILGNNYKEAGFGNVADFVLAMKASEREQLIAFSNFVQSKGLVKSLQNTDWSRFAAGYNGPSYKVNKYDQKMLDAYNKYKQQ